MRQTLIVAYFGNRTLGWSHVDGKPVFQGDKEWALRTKQASHDETFVSLYEGGVEGVANIDDPTNLKAVFLAMAALPRERIRIAACPDGMLESLGLSIQEIDEDEFYDEDELYGDTEDHEILSIPGDKILNGALKGI